MRKYGLNLLVLDLRATHFFIKWKELGVVVTFILRIAITVEVNMIPLRRTLFMSHFKMTINAEVAYRKTLTALYIYKYVFKKFSKKSAPKHNKCISKGVLCDRTCGFYLSRLNISKEAIVSGPFCCLARMGWFSKHTVFWG